MWYWTDEEFCGSVSPLLAHDAQGQGTQVVPIEMLTVYFPLLVFF